MTKSRGVAAAIIIVGVLCHLAEFRALAQFSEQVESVIIRAPKPYTQLVSSIQALGGKVKWQYKYVDAIAADIPTSAMTKLTNLVGSASLAKDSTVVLPGRVHRSTAGRSSIASDSTATSFTSLALPLVTSVAPAAYSLNNLGLNIRGLHRKGYTGAGVIVAVVDSGIRPTYPVLESDNSVIGGIDLVGDGLGFSNPMNDPHGTFVAGLISGNALINVAGTTLESSVQQNFPGALIGSDLPLIGSAPSSRIYVVRVLGVNASAGAPESRVIAALDQIINLKEDYDDHRAGGVNIQVVNLSLGNTTFHAGRDLFDAEIDKLLKYGIIPVVSAGDAGPSSLTVASPATSFSSIAVGAASPAANDRVERDIQNSLGDGIRFRPSSALQVAYFSSRGPNANGERSPDVIAVGLGNFSQGYGPPSEVSLNDGTSFSAPLVAGVAAVLRQAFPTASAAKIRNAIIGSGDSSLAGGDFTQLDQGKGFPDAQEAFDNFSSFSSALSPPINSQPSVIANVQQAGLSVLAGSFSQNTGKLDPAQRREFLYQIQPYTAQVVISVSNFASNPNVSPQNVFPEQIYLQVHSAKTSQIGGLGDYFDLGDPFITGGTFTINNPEAGIMRITLSGSYTNEAAVSAKVTVTSSVSSPPILTTEGTIADDDSIDFPVTIPKDVQLAEFTLWFDHDWSQYPTSDLDMKLIFRKNEDTQGAHLNAPERATILNPAKGTWIVRIIGFDISTPSLTDGYSLRVALDGVVVN